MVPNGNAYAEFPSFADSGTRVKPQPDAKYAQGFVPGDTYPAEWQNYFMHGAPAGITRLNEDTDSIKKEINSILAAYSITNDASAYNQLLTALSKTYPQMCSCDTAAGTAAKSVSLQGNVLKAGNIYVIEMTYGNQAANPTLSFNSGTAYPICNANGVAIGNGAWDAGDTITVLFTGTKYLMNTKAVENKIENNNMNAVTSNAVSCILASSQTITGPAIGTGAVIKIMFTADIAGTDTTTGFSLAYNGVSIPVKANKDGALVSFKAYETLANIYKYLQAYTVLDLVYDGTQFIIIGNPAVLTAELYNVYANGTVQELPIPGLLQSYSRKTVIQTNNVIDYEYTATEDCYVDGSQSWNTTTNHGGTVTVKLGGKVVACDSYDGYGNGTEDSGEQSKPVMCTPPIFIKKGTKVIFHYSGNGSTIYGGRVAVFTKP